MNIAYHIYRFKYRFAPYLSLQRPVDVSLELSSACNMRCAYCYHNDQKTLPFKRGMMTQQTIDRIIHEAAALDVPALKMNWKGESTLNPHFSHACKLAAQLARGSRFQERLSNTNFKFNTDRDDIFEGFAAQTKVKVSMDSFSKQVFEAQRLKGDHDLMMRNLDKFYHWPGRDNELVIQAVRTSANKDEDIEGEVLRRWPSATISIRDVVDGRKDESIGELGIRERDTSNRQTCIQAHARVIFNWQGRAFPCCPDVKETLCIGDIGKQSLGEIWNGRKAKRLRGDLHSKVAFRTRPACASCSSFESYKGFKPRWGS